MPFNSIARSQCMDAILGVQLRHPTRGWLTYRVLPPNHSWDEIQDSSFAGSRGLSRPSPPRSSWRAAAWPARRRKKQNKPKGDEERPQRQDSPLKHWAGRAADYKKLSACPPEDAPPRPPKGPALEQAQRSSEHQKYFHKKGFQNMTSSSFDFNF